MTPGISMDVQHYVWPCSFLCLQITTADTRPQVKLVVNLVIADGHLIFLRGFVGVCMG